jgi:hypothetical protein
VQRQVSLVLDPEQRCCQSGVVEVELRRLDQALPEVAVVRLQQEAVSR